MGFRDSQTGVSEGNAAEVSGSAPWETVFRKEGQFWTIVYQDRILRLRDTKGLRYIARLLLHPGTRFPARLLMQELLSELPPDLQSTPSPDPNEDERARLGVTKRIKAALKVIEAHHPALGYHLSTAVKTGANCVYSPDPSQPIVWRA